jgi:hypothetical protein
MKNQKGSATVWVIIIIVIIIIAGGIYFYLQPKQSAVLPLQNQIATSTDMTGWQTYTNDQYGFTLQYPAGVKVGTTSYIELWGETATGTTIDLSVDNGVSSNSFEITASPNQSLCTFPKDEPGAQQENINGVNFTIWPWENSPGNESWESVKMYDTTYDGICYQIRESVGGSYSSPVMEPDYNSVEEQVDPVFNQIMSTFKFTNQ